MIKNCKNNKKILSGMAGWIDNVVAVYLCMQQHKKYFVESHACSSALLVIIQYTYVCMEMRAVEQHYNEKTHISYELTQIF